MRTETAGVTETLIESAKKEFLEHGFQNANLRRISSESGVSTGSRSEERRVGKEC